MITSAQQQQNEKNFHFWITHTTYKLSPHTVLSDVLSKSLIVKVKKGVPSFLSDSIHASRSTKMRLTGRPNMYSLSNY